MLTKKEIYFLLIGLCFFVYANSLNNAFVSDDIPAILNNPYISSSPLKYWLTPSSFFNSLCHPVAKNNPFFYHLINTVVHSINTILVFYLLSLFFKTEASLLGACLFAVHPIHTEAVTWISGRPYAITALFILITFFLYYNATVEMGNAGGKVKLKAYLISLAVFSYYLFYNFSFYFLFPFLLMLFDFSFNRWKKAWRLWLPFLAIVAIRIILAKTLISERILYVAKNLGGLTWTNPIFNLTYSFFVNLWLLVWPKALTLYHEPPVISAFALKIEIFFLILLAVSLIFIFKKAKELFFGIGIFVLFLAPTYSPVMVSWLVAERYLYFPSIALSIFLAFFYEKVIVNSKKFKRIGLGFIMIIIAAYGARTIIRNEDYKAPERFWRTTVAVSEKSPRAHNNMGDVYFQEANTEGAIREFKKALELRPDYSDAYHNLASTYYSLGNIEEATKFYKQAIFYNPQLFESYFNLGLIYLNKEDYAPAIEYFKKAVDLRPGDAGASNGLKLALEKQSGA